MITRRTLIAGVASAAAAELAWARCGSRPTQQIVLTGRISAIGAESMELELARGVRTVLFSERLNPAGFRTGDVVSVTCRVTADGDFLAERVGRPGTRLNSPPAGQQPASSLPATNTRPGPDVSGSAPGIGRARLLTGLAARA